MRRLQAKMKTAG